MQATAPPLAPTPRSSPAVAQHPGDAGLLTFLTRLQVALNRRRTYGAAHPMVVRTEEEALVALDAVLTNRSSFTIGVAKQELMFNGATITSSSNITRELAARLHRRGVGALDVPCGCRPPAPATDARVAGVRAGSRRR